MALGDAQNAVETESKLWLFRKGIADVGGRDSGIQGPFGSVMGKDYGPVSLPNSGLLSQRQFLPPLPAHFQRNLSHVWRHFAGEGVTDI